LSYIVVGIDLIVRDIN